MEIVWTLVIGAVAGWLAGVAMKGKGFGLIGDIVLGLIGAFVGHFTLGLIGISIGGGLVGQILNAFIGAVIVIFVVRAIVKR